MRLAIGKGLMPLLMLLALPARAAAPEPLAVLGYDRAANQDKPEVCFRLSQTVARRPGAPLEDSVATDPQIPIAATPRRDRLCVTGFSFGQTYTVTLRSGLAGVSGALGKDAQFRIPIPDRPPEVGFAAPDADVLPRAKLGGLPVRSVNVPGIEVAIFRISDRDLLLGSGRPPLKGTALASFAPEHGERVWRGTISPKAEANRDATTLVPLDASIGAPKAGLYVAVVWPSGIPAERLDGDLPTQYFAVTDLGLVTWRSATGLVVAARSLATATPITGADVALVARNNRELGRLKTDENGFARFDPGLLRGENGDRPAGIMAYGAGGDFNLLRFPDAGPGGSDGILAYPDRSLYRPGDRVGLTLLTRNEAGAAVTKTNVVAQIVRPDGSIFESRSMSDQGAGGYAFDFALPESAPAGAWTVKVHREGDGLLLGNTPIEVEPLPLPRLGVTVASEAAILDPTQTGTVGVQTQYPDDGAAANVPGELRGTIQAAANPFPAFPGFIFGAADDAQKPVTLEPVRFTTDGGGKAYLPLKVTLPPRAAGPLELRLTARMLDPGGSPVEQEAVVPIAAQNLVLGVRPAPGSAFAEGQPARFEIIALSPDGARQEKIGAGWEVLREDQSLSWRWDGTRFIPMTEPRESHVAGGSVDIPADTPAIVNPSLPPGRYRIEVFDPGGEAASSAAFQVGWPEAGVAEVAARIEIKPPKPLFIPGEAQDIFVKPPFESDLLLVSADSQIRSTAAQHLPPAGGMVHLDIPPDAGQVLDLAAVALAPPDAAAPDLPRRAFQSASLVRDPATRRLGVKLALPDKAAPQQDLHVQVSVEGAGDEPAFVRITADDRETGAAWADQGQEQTATAADPGSRLAVDDVYSRIITASGFRGHEIRTMERIPHLSTELRSKPARFALFSGIVALDKTGKAVVPLTLPDVTGNVSVHAVAWSASRYGVAEGMVPVRYALTLSLPVPALLRPDDHADLMLALDNSGGPRGEYHVKVTADGAITEVADASATFNLAEHEQRVQPIAIQAGGAGEGHIAIEVTGPDIAPFTRRFSLPVLQAAAPAYRHATITLKPNTPLSLDPALVAGLKADTVVVSLAAGKGLHLDQRGLARELSDAVPDTAEAIIGAATPCMASGVGPAIGPPGKACLERAAGLLLARQREDGSFARMGADEGDLWLTASVADFLGHARGAGATVADAPIRATSDFLKLQVLRAETADRNAEPHLPPPDATAYAALVLARCNRLTIFELRSLEEQMLAETPSALTLGLIGAAFASLGDKETAAADFGQALALPPEKLSGDAAGSDLRDRALLAALMAESGAAAQPSILAAFDKAVSALAGRRELTAEEAAWLFRAGAAITAPSGEIKIKAGDETFAKAEPYIAVTRAGESFPVIKNTGDAPVSIALTVSGLPSQGEAKEPGGAEIERAVFDLAGKPVDPASVRQGDVLVLVLSGRTSGTRPLIVDPLPAGWAVEAAEIDNAGDRYPWLKDLTGASYTATGEGRFVAIPTVTDKHELKLAYVVRVACRGQFALPGPELLDLAAPSLSARGAAGRMKVDPAS